jgi:hypothetical protein
LIERRVSLVFVIGVYSPIQPPKESSLAAGIVVAKVTRRMKSPLHFFHRPLSRLVAGWCAVVLYMGAFTSFGPLFAALVGGMDVDHHVQLAADADGVRVVLHHGEACLHGHHHGLVAQALTLMAEPPSQSDPDHILQFHASAAADKQKRLLFADESRGDCRDFLLPLPYHPPLRSVTPAAGDR